MSGVGKIEMVVVDPGCRDYNTRAFMDTVSLTNHFLIAMPAMADPNFSRTLTYICEHNSDGALGVIVNRPIDMTLADLFDRVDIPVDSGDLSQRMAYFGGPVQTDRGFVLHRPPGAWQSSLRVGDEVALTSSRDVLVSIGQTGTPTDAMVFLGYSGWAAGQLEQELAQNAWLTVEADPGVVFNLRPEERLSAAMKLLGFDMAHLSDVAGHA